MTMCNSSSVSIVVCATCRDADGSTQKPLPGRQLAEVVCQAAHGTGIEVLEVDCLGNCKRRLSAAMSRQHGWTYVFGDLTVESACDLIEGALLFQKAEDGILPWRGRPDALKRGLIARFPPLHATRKMTRKMK